MVGRRSIRGRGTTRTRVAAVCVALAAATVACLGPSRGPVSLSGMEVWQVDDTTLAVSVPSCNGDPEVAQVVETPAEVRIEIVTTVPRGGGDDCLDSVQVHLDAPMGSRSLVDHTSGEEMAVQRPASLGVLSVADLVIAIPARRNGVED